MQRFDMQTLFSYRKRWQQNVIHWFNMLNGVTNFYGKNIDQLISEINENAHGGWCTYLNDYSLSEIQIACKEIVIDKKID